MCTKPSAFTPVAATWRFRDVPDSISSVSVEVGAGKAAANGGVWSRRRISAGASARSPRATSPPPRAPGSIPSAIGGRLNVPLSSRGSVRTTAVVSGASSRSRDDVGGGRHVDRQSAPTWRARRPRGCGARSSVRRRHDQQAHRAAAAARRRSRPGRSTDAPAREVAREMPGPADPRVERTEHEQEEPEGEERAAEQEQRGRHEDQRVDLAGAGLGPRSGPQLEEREHAERQDEQLHRHARESGLSSRRRARRLEDRPRDVGHRKGRSG